MPHTIMSWLIVMIWIAIILIAIGTWPMYSTLTEKREMLYRYLWVKWHYYHLRERKRYVWSARATFGGGFETPPLNKRNAIMHVADSGGRILGVDEINKFIFYRPRDQG